MPTMANAAVRSPCVAGNVERKVLRSVFACTLTSRSVGIGYPLGLGRPAALVAMVTRSGQASKADRPTTQPTVTAYLSPAGMRNRESVRLALLTGPILRVRTPP